jgi:hypothetical protein
MTWGDFLYKWQDLTGAALGPFLAIILSALGFWVKEKRAAIRERKEAHRRIEIAVARSLNDAFILREQLKWMAGRVNTLARAARAITEPNIFFMNRVNFIPMREIYRDADLSRFKVRSYYIHNKLLFLDAGIKETNEAVVGLKNDFEEIVKQNATLVALMNDTPNPPMQRETYAANLEAFATEAEGYATSFLNTGIKTMVQLKVYNNLLRERHGYWVWWRNESTWLKYFRTKTEQKKYARTLNSLDAIDALIETKVQQIMQEAETRGEKFRPS